MLNEIIKKKIEEEYGSEIRYSKDCEGLSLDVTKKCKRNISTSTLKRVFGFATQTSQPHKHTLDVLAIYIGYNSWDEIEIGKEVPLFPESNLALKKKKRISQRTAILVIGLIILAVLFIGYKKYGVESSDWKNLANMPEVRTGGSVVVADNHVYYIGGADAEFMRSNTWCLDLKRNVWEEKAPLVAVGEAAAVYLKGRIYLFGGYNGNQPTDAALVYSISKNIWDTLSHLPHKITSCSAITYGEKIFLLGNTLGDTKTFFFSYDPKLNTYDSLPIFNTQRSFANLVLFKDKIYAVGGGGLRKGEYVWYNLCDVFDLKKRTWKKRSNMPSPMTRSAVVLVNNKIHVLGGSNAFGKGSHGNTTDIHYIFDPKENKWEISSVLPFKISGHKCVTVNDKIILLGGTREFPNPRKETFILH